MCKPYHPSYGKKATYAGRLLPYKTPVPTELSSEVHIVYQKLAKSMAGTCKQQAFPLGSLTHYNTV